MKKYYQWFFYLVILGVLVWGFVTPSGIRGALANNIWSTRFVKTYYEDPSSLSQLPFSPPTHIHGNLFQIQRALQQKDYDLAMDYIDPAVEDLDPLTMDAYVSILFLQEDYTEALDIWEEIGDVRMIELAALNLVDKERQDLALLGYRALYQVNPDKYTISFAIFLKNNGELEESLRIFQQSIKEFPDSEYKYHWLRYSADIFRAQGKFDEAISSYMNALKVNPEDSRTWRNLALLYSINFKDYERATACFEKIVEIYPDDPLSYFQLGQSYESSGSLDEAIQAYKNTLELDQGYIEAKHALERLTGSN